MSLHKEDLKYTMFDIFEVDSYSSKMGDDSDIVTVSFSLKEKAPADDLVKFLESGMIIFLMLMYLQVNNLIILTKFL